MSRTIIEIFEEWDSEMKRLKEEYPDAPASWFKERHKDYALMGMAQIRSIVYSNNTLRRRTKK